MVFDFFGSKKKVIVGMVHIGALPGTPLYDADGGMAKLIDGAQADIAALQAAGVDAVMFGNENDRPYQLKAPAEGIAAMTAVVASCKPEIKLPFGVNWLWDPAGSVAIATATGASFAREIFTGLFASDMGMWEPDCAAALRLRRNLHNQNLKLLFNINAEFADTLDKRPIEMRARSAVFSSLADAILVSGPLTGQGADASDLRKVAQAVGGKVPVFANTGVNIDSVKGILEHADGCIVGTHFKVNGDTWNRVDGERARRFMDHVNTLR
ncbi:MAG: BtpA/SgcQ family protein [Burkholderiales bacterium]|nr:BtpA/SgcQ family protein [Burkholderiales bacterium]MDE2455912.1 BtpA/SgcQ family protein [Burkholderiales bacterium]